MQRFIRFWSLTILLLAAILPAFSHDKRDSEPWWVNFQAQYQQASDDGLRFQWNEQTSQIELQGTIEFVFLGKASGLGSQQKQAYLDAYRQAIQHYWSLPFNASEERSDVQACGRYFGGFQYHEVQFQIANLQDSVLPGANRVYFYNEEEIPADLKVEKILHTTFPTISGEEGVFAADPFWARKGEAVLPAFTQFLPLPRQTSGNQEGFGNQQSTGPSWPMFVGHEFGHVLGLPDGWQYKGDQVVVTDGELMSYLYWEINPQPRATHAYFAEIISRIFLCDVSWKSGSNTYWVSPGQ